MRVYFDASIIIASLISTTGGSSLLLEYIKLKKVIGITSQTVIDEVLEEDKYKKLHKSKTQIKQFIAQSGLLVRESITALEIAPYQKIVDTEDAHLIAGAKLTRCQYLVTLDKKHLLKDEIRGKVLPLKIVNPKKILEELVSK